ncbi:precorrin-3B C17-methyltransferase [Methanolacinia petrolearia DSM 11571]|uniref:Precorrin-3B C17-methyltransferase n=1 Tax=Methanolacinia petrolearia (strain DSM 11571 / OCM 486 / SEBR 4847) TaxID=679926 RepID=E1RHX3_METP4|nr:precorrin-3B C(17)-methyltransferase [Methanolacinia petrolearia]ADN36511.1 precorrin-3B C17-methyltransferase [Methanolacinia petrolearia DSM 11571]
MQSSGNDNKGKLFIVGTGPGKDTQLTGRAIEAIRESDIIIGNDFYLDHIPECLEGKEVIRSSMGKEVDRAKRCVELAETRKVCMVSGGDPGIYGMASIVLEVIAHENSCIDYEVVPGVTAATAAASLAGSPLSGDYVTISLSDLLTPLEIIEKRLDLAFQIGIPVALYNPKSRGRPANLSLALSIALKYKKEETPVAVVKNAYRENEDKRFFTLKSLFDDDSFVDMSSIVIIGGEETRIQDVCGKEIMITPRGYDRKYVY